MNAQRHLHVTDIEEILSWTPHEYQLLLKGAQYRKIDEYDYMANLAMAIGYASRAKKPNKNSIFNSNKAKRRLEGRGESDVEFALKMNKALKGFQPQISPKKKVNR